MTSAHQWLSGISSWLWPVLIHHLWQATLFAAVVWVFCVLAKPASSKTRYGVWLLASFKFAVPAFLVAWIAAQLDIHIPWPRKTISASSTSISVEFPLSKQIEQLTLVVGRLEAHTTITENTHKELYCALTLVWALGCVFFLRVWWCGHRTMKMKLGKGERLISG